MAKNKRNKRLYPEKPTVTRFSFKSAFIILLSILAATLVFPMILDSMGLDLKWLRIIVITLTSAFSFSYCLFVIEKKESINKKFWMFFAVVALFTAIVAYYWVFEIYYI